MREEIYQYLRNYGFTKEEVKALKKNEDIYYAIMINITENIEFLEDLGLTKEEVISIINTNPFLITCTKKRKDAFNKIYINNLGITKEEIKNMLFINSYIYNLIPITVEILINDLLKTYSKEDLKQEIINNPKLLNGKDLG